MYNYKPPNKLEAFLADIFKEVELFLLDLIGPNVLQMVENVFLFLLFLGIICLAAYVIGNRLRRDEDAAKYKKLERIANVESISPEKMITCLQERLAKAEARASAAEAELAHLREQIHTAREGS